MQQHLSLKFIDFDRFSDWRRELEGALFHFKRLQLRKKESPTNGENMFGQTPEQVSSYGRMDDWEKVKISLPLDRIVKNEVADYMGFATLIGTSIIACLFSNSLSTSTLSSPVMYPFLA